MKNGWVLVIFAAIALYLMSKYAPAPMQSTQPGAGSLNGQ